MVKNIHTTQGRVAAHYRVTDLVVRRDWYSVANVFAAGEVSEQEAQQILHLLSEVSLDELALLESQLQLSGLAPVYTMGEARTKNVNTVIATGLELSRRRAMLSNADEAHSVDSLAYRRHIEKLLRSAISYHYTSRDMQVVLRATHRTAESLRRHTVHDSDRVDALTTILRRDPQLISGLVDEGHVSPREVMRALEQSRLAPIDGVRLIVSIPELLTKEKYRSDYVELCDLGAIAQLRDEVSHQHIQRLFDARVATLLAQAPLDEAGNVLRYAGLYGNEYVYVTGRYQSLLKSVLSLDGDDIEQLRAVIEEVELPYSVGSLSKLPILRNFDSTEAVAYLVMLGERYLWARKFADDLMIHDEASVLTQAWCLCLLDDAAALSRGYDRARLDRINQKLYSLSTRFRIDAGELYTYVPQMTQVIESMVSHTPLVQDDIITLACLARDRESRTQLLRYFDEQICSELIERSLRKSVLARQFWALLDTADVLHVILRWGNTTRNGYLLRLVANVSMDHYRLLIQELESRSVPVASLAEIDDILWVIDQAYQHDTVISERSMAFIGQIISAYSRDVAERFVNKLGIHYLSELETVSPFYVRLVMDVNDAAIIDQLRGKESTLTFAEAQKIRDEYFAEHRSFVSRVLSSMQRVIGSELQQEKGSILESV
ncbi:MAG: hypothetical protein WBP22_00720 [Candidatus Saccharimonas sp.]